MYEAYDTFPEMTEALDVDVTSETVRRYMVKYDIHEPNDNRETVNFSPPSARSDADAETNEGYRLSTNETTPKSHPSKSVEPTDIEAMSELGNRSIAEIVAEANNQSSGPTLVDDGLGIPTNLTVAELTHAINQSNSVSEIKYRLDMSQRDARQLLQEFDLVDFVTNGLVANQITISHKEIERRISVNSSN